MEFKKLYPFLCRSNFTVWVIYYLIYTAIDTPSAISSSTTFHKEPDDDDDECLFVTERRPKRRMSIDLMRYIIKRISNRAGIKKILILTNLGTVMPHI